MLLRNWPQLAHAVATRQLAPEEYCCRLELEPLLSGVPSELMSRRSWLAEHVAELRQAAAGEQPKQRETVMPAADEIGNCTEKIVKTQRSHRGEVTALCPEWGSASDLHFPNQRKR